MSGVYLEIVNRGLLNFFNIPLFYWCAWRRRFLKGASPKSAR